MCGVTGDSRAVRVAAWESNVSLRPGAWWGSDAAGTVAVMESLFHLWGWKCLQHTPVPETAGFGDLKFRQPF